MSDRAAEGSACKHGVQELCSICLGPDGFHRCGLGALAHDANGSLALPSFVPNCDEGGDEPSAPMTNLGPLEQGIFEAIAGDDMEAVCRFFAMVSLRIRQPPAAGSSSSTH